MPFNGSGTFTIVNTFTPNTTISSSAVNGNFSDIAAGLSDCLTRDGQAGMSAPLDIVSGTVGNPGLEFTSQQGTGLYLASAGNVGLAIASAAAFAFSAPSTANGAGILGSWVRFFCRLARYGIMQEVLNQQDGCSATGRKSARPPIRSFIL